MTSLLDRLLQSRSTPDLAPAIQFALRFNYSLTLVSTRPRSARWPWYHKGHSSTTRSPAAPDELYVLVVLATHLHSHCYTMPARKQCTRSTRGTTKRSFVSQILVRSKEATHTKTPMCTQRHRRETGTPGVIEQEWIKMARVALEKTFWPNDERIRNSPSAHHHFVQPQSACRRMDAEMSPLSKLQATAHLFDLLMRHVTLL